ncbi:hypothetical protein TPHA_0N00350 [Tetrapisispora phaffii CBS 4417]|uniref:RAM signaling network component n=1 Tax=Tetrapisispora phaffii (strain ATCC 24235 / CBS 4417 / NBRC 1672 / NRRL Y-8282 / UCD 70-5) TaxID=1071381 RepID=G8C0Y8_TETPH|nr:hypothetical protein TPHA_0N00350 [Tetrapisispora phaffii CBS 4417]CCE65816.1 hypothetical protein TPHA_0N00350 [Tetrapisispora phaffii CBS 4417]
MQGASSVNEPASSSFMESVESTRAKDQMNLTLLIKNELSKQDSTNSTLKLIDLNITSISVTDVELLNSVNVERLSLRKNRLISLPSKFCNSKSLRYLDLNGNMFRDIPSILMQCPQLEILDLSSNNIETLPHDISKLWSKNLKVLSLKNNNLTSIFDFAPIVKLENLSILEIEGNLIPKDELELVKKYTPMSSDLSKEEYWAIALRRYLKDNFIENHTSHYQYNESNPSHGNVNKITRAAKRMGFINTLSPSNSTLVDNSDTLTPAASSNTSINNSDNDPLFASTPTTTKFSASSTTSTSNGNQLAETHINKESDNQSHNELYNHTKYNDYFKRLSVLQEEVPVNNEVSVGHDEIVMMGRKLLFSFSECQQNVRKITSFCKEKSVAVEVVSLLYSVRSEIDNLVEILEKSEEYDPASDRALLKLCLKINDIFKLIFGLLLKNFDIFFKSDDLCFIRMFYMTMITSYSEIYNAWCFISPEKLNTPKNIPHLHNFPHGNLNSISTTSISDQNGKGLSRTRSNTIQVRLPALKNSISTPTMHTQPTSASTTGSPAVQLNASNSAYLSSSGVLNSNRTPGTLSSSMSQISMPEKLPEYISKQSSPHIKLVTDDEKVPEGNVIEFETTSTDISNQLASTAYTPLVSSKPKPGPASLNISTTAVGNPTTNMPPIPPTPTAASLIDTDIDAQLHKTLLTVVRMVSVVYDQLTAAISQTALAGSQGSQDITESLTNKIHDLATTCRQSMELSKVLNARLNALSSTDNLISQKYSNNNEKYITWENINAFLKSIISILASTKVVMAEMPILNEIRPNLASLAKITKDVTVILDLSTYKSVSLMNVPSSSQPQTQIQTQPN